MLGVYVSVPVASFRRGYAREYLESEIMPPPSTCYGFLLSLVGECERQRHEGCRVTATLLAEPERSNVLRTVWRVKNTGAGLGRGGNKTPAVQELLTGVRLVVWIDSSDESGQAPNLEERVAVALRDPSCVERSGGLSLGESTHLVDEVRIAANAEARDGRTFLVKDRGRITLPVWVDHVGSAGTRFATGDLVVMANSKPLKDEVPRILGSSSGKGRRSEL
jgi:CRISPR-associated protein Cas5t